MLAAAMIVPLLLVGCGGGGGTAEGNGAKGGGSKSAEQQQLCDSLKTLNNALTDLANLDPQTASTADIEAAAAEVRKANKAVTASAGSVSKSSVQNVTLASTRLVTAVQNVPEGTSAQKELQMVQPALKATQTQFQASYNGLACESTG